MMENDQENDTTLLWNTANPASLFEDVEIFASNMLVDTDGPPSILSSATSCPGCLRHDYIGYRALHDIGPPALDIPDRVTLRVAIDQGRHMARAKFSCCRRLKVQVNGLGQHVARYFEGNCLQCVREKVQYLMKTCEKHT